MRQEIKKFISPFIEKLIKANKETKLEPSPERWLFMAKVNDYHAEQLFILHQEKIRNAIKSSKRVNMFEIYPYTW